MIDSQDIVEVTFATSRNLESLAKEINKLLKHGWVLYNPITCTPETQRAYSYHTQQMVKLKPENKEKL